MKRHNHNDVVGYGIYCSPRSLDVRFVGADGEALAGKPGAQYIRLPMILALAVGAVLGGAFVMAFPLIVLAATVYGVSRAVANRVGRAFEKRAYLAMLRWEPVGSYLNGSRKRDAEARSDETDGQAPTGAPTDDLADLRDEVADRREKE